MQNQDLMTLVEQLNTPAFLVQDGMIVYTNLAAESYRISRDAPAEQILLTGKEELAQLQEGSLFLTISLNGMPFPCSVTKLQDHLLFQVEAYADQQSLQAMALASSQLYMPISDISLLLDRQPNIPESDRAKLTHALFKLQRIVGNMADAAQYKSQSAQKATCELCSVLEEALEKAKTLLETNGTVLSYALPATPIYALADSAMLQRAVYNLISNAVRYSPPHTPIQVTVERNNRKLHISVCNTVKDSPTPGHMFFTRYRRNPVLESPNTGIGLGMTLIHSAATAHGGAVFVEQTDEINCRITMTVALEKSKSSNVHSPILKPDIYGGYDSALVELSDVLTFRSYL